MNPLSFKLTIKDYDSSSPLKDKEIQITNIDSKKCYESKFTTSNGEVLFEIPKNERGDFFSVKLINDNDYEVNPYYLAKESSNTHKNASTSSNTNNSPESKNTTNKILTPNNYQKYPATLYFKANISLYFNGFALFVMQGDKEIASYEARSGKALTLQEKEALEKQKGYTHFVPSFANFGNTTNGLNNIEHIKNNDLQSNCAFFHCYDKGYQDENKVLQDKAYYINTQEIKDFINANNPNNTDSAESSTHLSLNIYTDKECNELCSSIIMVSDKNLANNKQIQNDILLSYDDSNNLRYIFNNTNHTNIPLKVQYNKQTISYIKFIENIEWELDSSQNLPQALAKQNQTKIQYLNHNPNNYNSPIKAPFAPGTYIELEAVMNNDSQSGNVKWWLTFDTKLKLDNKINDESNYFHKNNQYNKIGFYLPLQKQNDKDYVIVYATLNNAIINNAFIVIKIDFNVGIGADNSVSESQRSNQSKMQYGRILNSDDINEWNKLQHIYSVDEAVWFLKANLKKLDEFKRNNNKRYSQKDSKGNYIYNATFDYFRIYPQFAGKIAYIYYRFDLGNDDFIKSIISDNLEYVRDRNNFIDKAVEVYIGFCDSTINKPIICNVINTITGSHKQKFENAFLRGNANWKQLIENFIYDICDKLSIQQKFRPKIDTNPNLGDSGTYHRDTNTISIKPPNITRDSFIDFIDTTIHEFRHFYIWYVFEDAQGHKLTKSSVAKLIYYNDTFYIAWSYDKFFNAYDKKCAIFDAEVKKCIMGKKYSIRKDSTPLYFIQPSERDCRIVAWKFKQGKR